MEPYKLRDLLWFGNIVLILAVFSSSFYIVQQIRNEKEIKLPEPPPEEKIQEKKISRIFDYAPIWEVKIAPEKAEVIVETGPTPEEELKKLLEIDGVAYKGVSKENAYATIKTTSNRKTKLVYIGDIFNPAQSEWYRKEMAPADIVHPAKVLDLSGAGVTFRFKDEEFILAPKTGAEQETPENRGGFAKSEEISPGYWQISGAERDSVIGNPDQYIKEAGVVPYYERGRFAGLKLKKVEAGSLAEQRGFKKHDVVDKINGITITSMEQLQAIIDREKSKTRFIVNVMRLGKPVTLTFDVK